MIGEVWNILENYGWFIIFGIIVLYSLYSFLLEPQVRTLKENRDLALRKKFDESVHSKVAEDLEYVRQRQQEEHDKVSAELKEKEEQKKAKKLEELLQEKKQAPQSSGYSNLKSSKKAPGEIIDHYISSKPIVMFSKTSCPFCRKAKSLFATFRLSTQYFEFIELDERDDLPGEAIQQEFIRRYGSRSVPKVFINGDCIGGCDDTVELNNQGVLEVLVMQAIELFDEQKKN